MYHRERESGVCECVKESHRLHISIIYVSTAKHRSIYSVIFDLKKNDLDEHGDVIDGYDGIPSYVVGIGSLFQVSSVRHVGYFLAFIFCGRF